MKKRQTPTPAEGSPDPKKSKTRKTRIVSATPDWTSDLCIDDDDCHVFFEIVSTGMNLKMTRAFSREALEVWTGLTDQERRIHTLCITDGYAYWKDWSVRPIRTKRNFTGMLSSLPREIGQLQRLEILDLSGMWKLSSLPGEIGRLASLEKLILTKTGIVSLPDEIGRLASLKELCLCGTKITSLPGSIGQLQSLQHLDLSCTIEFSKLPEEVGNLCNLILLDASTSKIASLPASVGKLKNLQYLRLDRTDRLLNLPDEIGHLSRLKFLNLGYSKITALPSSVHRLRNLMYLLLSDTNIPELYASNFSDYLLALAQKCPVLGFLALNHLRGSTENKLAYALARNRSRIRTRYKTIDGDSGMELLVKLWPLLLTKVTRALSGSHVLDERNLSFVYDDQHFLELHNISIGSSKPDSIYLLLEDQRELFLGILIDRFRTAA